MKKETTEKLTEVIQVKVKKTEKDELQALANKDVRDLSPFCRIHLLKLLDKKK